MSHVKLVSDGTPMGTKTFVDGKELRGVTAVSFHIGLVEDAKITVEMYVDEIEIDGHAELTAKGIEMPASWRAILAERADAAKPEGA